MFGIPVAAGLICAVTGLVVYPRQAADAAAAGVSMCFEVLIPSLFPFLVLSSLMLGLGFTRYLSRIFEPVMRPLFGVSGECSGAIIMGFLGGSPIGAKTVVSMYESGMCSSLEAERMLSWCNNSGPAFVLGVAGAGVFASRSAGILLYTVHVFSALLVGLMFRHYGGNDSAKHSRPTCTAFARRPFPRVFVEAVSSSFMSVLGICGFVIFFTVITRLLYISGILPFLARTLGLLLTPLGLNGDDVLRLSAGMIELSGGILSLSSSSASLSAGLAMAAFMLGWSGLSVHCQVLSVIGDSALRCESYFAGKLLQSVISAVLAYVCSKPLLKSQSAAAFVIPQSVVPVSPGLVRNISIGIACALCLLAFAAAAAEKHYGNKA